MTVPRNWGDRAGRIGGTRTGLAATARVARCAWIVLCGMLLVATAARAQTPTSTATSPRVLDEYRLTAFPFYPLGDKWTGFGYLGYVSKHDAGYESYYLGLGAYYQPTPHIQLWAALINIYTDSAEASNTLELRPFVAFKYMGETGFNIRYHNWTRYEFRETRDLDTGDWTEVRRIRNQSRIDVPLASADRSWTPGTWYAFTDIEPTWRSDTAQLDPLRWRIGLGYITPHVVMELQYYKQWTRPGGGDLTYTDNIFRLNFKFLNKAGMLSGTDKLTAGRIGD